MSRKYHISICGLSEKSECSPKMMIVQLHYAGKADSKSPFLIWSRTTAKSCFSYVSKTPESIVERGFVIPNFRTSDQFFTVAINYVENKPFSVRLIKLIIGNPRFFLEDF